MLDHVLRVGLLPVVAVAIAAATGTLDAWRSLADTVLPRFTLTTLALVAMVSYSIVYRRGVATFLDDAKAAGMLANAYRELGDDEVHEALELAQSEGPELVITYTGFFMGRQSPDCFLRGLAL